MKSILFSILFSITLNASAFADSKVLCTSLVASKSGEDWAGPYNLELKAPKKKLKNGPIETNKVAIMVEDGAKSPEFDIDLYAGGMMLVSTTFKGVYFSVAAHNDNGRTLAAFRMQSAHVVCELNPKIEPVTDK